MPNHTGIKGQKYPNTAEKVWHFSPQSQHLENEKLEKYY